MKELRTSHSDGPAGHASGGVNTKQSAEYYVNPFSDAPFETPLWLRVSDAAKLYSVGRGTLYKWIERGLIRSVSLKTRGQVRGGRRICAASIAEFFDTMAADQMKAQAKGGNE